MNTSTLLKAFNDQFEAFVNDVQLVFQEDTDILTAKNTLITIRKANPTILVKVWKTYINDKYETEISKGDIGFFLEKDYTDDVNNMKEQEQILNKINLLRNPIREMDEENKNICMKYIQNLSTLSKMYIESKNT